MFGGLFFGAVGVEKDREKIRKDLERLVEIMRKISEFIKKVTIDKN